MVQKRIRRTDQEWLDLIQECRTSGLTDKAWCEQQHIQRSNFYYQIRRLRKKACVLTSYKINSRHVQTTHYSSSKSSSFQSGYC